MNDQDPAQRIPGTSWADEMDILDPILDEQARDEACVVEFSPHTEACITVSFHSMPNSARRSLWSKFILPKAPVTRTPLLDKIYADSCSKSTQQADRSLARVQALMLDAAGPISEALKQLNTTTEDDSEEVELDLEKLGSTLEAALTFLSNASTQTSNLRRLKLMRTSTKTWSPILWTRKNTSLPKPQCCLETSSRRTLQNTGSKSKPYGRCVTAHWPPIDIGFSEGLLLTQKEESISPEDTLQQGGTRCTKGA